MPNKANKFSKREKSLTANAEVNPLPKEPHSALAVVAVVAVAVVKAVRRRKAVVVAKRVVQRVRVQAKTIRLQSTG